jgi:hypothetical protein
MKLVSFLLGALAGAWITAGLYVSAEVVRAYRDNIDLDPWQEYASEEAPAKPFDWERWKTADELNQERKAKNEFYNREEVETDTRDDEEL